MNGHDSLAVADAADHRSEQHGGVPEVGSVTVVALPQSGTVWDERESAAQDAPVGRTLLHLVGAVALTGLVTGLLAGGVLAWLVP